MRFMLATTLAAFLALAAHAGAAEPREFHSLVLYTAPGCIPCEQLKIELARPEVAQRVRRIRHSINNSANEHDRIIASARGVDTFPTLIVWQFTEYHPERWRLTEVRRHVGLFSSTKALVDFVTIRK